MLQIGAKCSEIMFITSIIHEYGVAKKKGLDKTDPKSHFA
jgi:methionine salvage enolase-phosphatase E1